MIKKIKEWNAKRKQRKAEELEHELQFSECQSKTKLLLQNLMHGRSSDALSSREEMPRLFPALAKTECDAILAEACKDYFEALFANIISDYEVSPEEDEKWSRLADICKEFGVVISTTSVDKAFEGGRHIYNIKTAPLAELAIASSGHGLANGELRLLEIDGVSLLKKERVTKGLMYHGPQARIKIAKGLYYRVGAYSGKKITTERTVTEDEGQLILTNKKLYFIGRNKSVNMRFSSIHDIIFYNDGLQVKKTSGSHTTFTCNLGLFEETLIARVLSE